MDPQRDSCDVVVVGAGPVGLTLTLLLALKGRSVALVDPNRIVCQHPRATHLDDETMRTLQTLGAADLEPRFLRQRAWKLTADGAVFLEFHMPGGDSDQGWYADYQFHQPDFESRLRGLLLDRHVDLRLGETVVDFEQDDDAVTVTMADAATGELRSLRGGYLVGADGANSLVRRLLAPEVQDLDGTQRSLIIDVHPFEPPATLPDTEGFVACDGERPLTFVPIFPPKLRFEFMLNDEDDKAACERPQNVYRLLDPWLPPGGYRILRTDVYEWHARLVRGWRDRRVLLAGDAAHEMPPMLGQGMCSGLRDAMNLAWKLAAVADGADPALLDTYESERAPHVLPYIVESARQSNLIESFADPANRPEPGSPPQTLIRHRPLLGPGLTGSPADPVGQLMPQPVSEDGARLDDIVGYEFLVVGRADVLGAVSAATRSAWAALGAAVMDSPPPSMLSWLDAHHANAAIARPDRYCFAVAGTAGELDAASADLASRVLPVRTPA
ncbi:bifunctional 3-(3-hydroxy-phenyl)propionate/3-hydroxycinnamic acid hydroxylase [Actinomadura syzygii]|uniref:Bifunctional 3-(3-hydroxy-phenyl)propionate/3-hydroxycinnamic acid hydroxylase n=1 Tax=Actinomadura syzygii TaxID=1427538 RepID=A0A5D0UEA3_9ACTN|nr:bifunctional 3-(3-hydroxy-phenyl)propionate/3-hydroxycinnamic acid hydroxylase [Actinomadura syzygii]TYC15913.1 bifunctional 3-(3-hydroxy-phenyl)propionate/3-hydroxycinnamic acid hydroxylase [Actinomadura syzygii]